MIDKRFSIEAFNKLETGSKEKENLLKDLGDEMASLINKASEKAFTEVATKLIELGCIFWPNVNTDSGAS